MKNIEKFKLGEVLLSSGVVTQSQLDSALSIQKGTNRKLGKILVEQKYVTEEEISKVIAKQLKIEFVFLNAKEIDLDYVSKLNESQSRRYKSLVINKIKVGNKEELLVAMVDPSDIRTQDELSRILGGDIEVVCVTDQDLMLHIDKFYAAKNDVNDLANNLEKDIKNTNENINSNRNNLVVEDAPVIKLLQNIFEDAYKNGISDVHIEPQKDQTFIRFRKDGELMLHTQFNNTICGHLVSRLKIISQLDISEKRLPQDGRFQTMVFNNPIDIRISIIPQSFGEAVVLRILNQNTKLLDLEKIGMPKNILEKMESVLGSEEGMLLVVGPTGSGKTTTLYACISEINDIKKKIITIEDPVEYQLPLINQIQVNEKIDFTFDKILRTVLRQDPDVILIGEIRDSETANIAMRGAITGHLILSTLHTKDSVSTPVRLVDMGVPSYMVASALEGIISQRLLRKNCDNCLVDENLENEKDKIFIKELFSKKIENEGDSDFETQQAVNAEFKDGNYLGKKFKKSKGCNACNFSGFSGRTGVYEFLYFDNELKKYLYKNDMLGFQDCANKKLQGFSMQDHLIELLLNGEIGIKEARKIGSGE